MKKFIFMIAVLFATTFANAQITLLQSDVNLMVGSNVEVIRRSSWALLDITRNIDLNYFVIGDYIIDDQTSNSLQQTLDLYDEDLNLVKSFTLAQLGVTNINQVAFISHNIFTTDGTWAWLRFNNNTSNFEIVGEEGTIIKTMPGYVNINVLIKVGHRYLLGLGKNYQNIYDIYSLPGNGEATDVSEVSAPQKNARKYLHNDQVLIGSNDKTYTLQGQEVR